MYGAFVIGAGWAFAAAVSFRALGSDMEPVDGSAFCAEAVGYSFCQEPGSVRARTVLRYLAGGGGRRGVTGADEARGLSGERVFAGVPGQVAGDDDNDQAGMFGQ